jgi:hypothetical protein
LISLLLAAGTRSDKKEEGLTIFMGAPVHHINWI